MKHAIFMLFLLPVMVFAAATNDLPKLIPAYGELPPTFWEQHQTMIIVAGFALVAVVLLSLQVMFRPKTPVILPPETIARRALSKFQGRPEDGKMLSEISRILRRYLCAAFALPPVEMTTAEFSAALATNAKIDDELGQKILSFLRGCDDRKFSPAGPVAAVNAVTGALI